MTADEPPVFERQAAVQAVRALISPAHPVPAGQRRPVVLFEGGHGSGKTLLLTALAARADQHVPCARADFTEARHDDIPHVLSLLAGQLTRYRPRYRRLRFPRLLIGLLVLEEDLSLHDFEQARAAISQLLKQRRSGSWPQRFLRGLAGNPPEVEVQLTLTVALLRLPLNALAAVTGFTFTNRSQRWFGHRDRGRTDQAVDTLVALNAAARRERDDPAGPQGEAARAEVAGLLCEAFLADLRDCPRRVRRLNTPLLLLDNVDTPAGRAFLRRLLDAGPPLRPEDRPEPLTVVATCREPFPELAEGPVARLADVLGTAGARPSAAAEPPMWVRYRLPDLTRPDIQQLMSDALRGDRADRRLVRLVHEFTAGHPEAVGVLARTAARPARPADGVGELLDRPLPSPDRWEPGPPQDQQPQPTATAGAWLLRRLLPGDEQRIDAFATCAAAMSEQSGLWLSHQPDLVDTAWGDEIRQAAPWSPADPAGPAVLRRLLLRRLAAREPGERDWRTVHLRLRRHCQENGDTAGELYHRLAVDELTPVALELAARLPAMPGQDWLELLQTAARAPFGSVERQRQQPYALFHTLVNESGAAADDAVATGIVHLVTALRIVGDPLCGIAREFLYTQIAGALSALAPQSPDGLLVLQQAVAEYRRQAQWWA